MSVEITLRGVWRNYGEQVALAGVDAVLPAGRLIAVVGSSGSGKTSLVNLVPRFYEPTAGRLFIDGHDITTLTLASLRAQIAMVSQDVLLFNDTVAANIASGAMAGASREEVERAAAAVGHPARRLAPAAASSAGPAACRSPRRCVFGWCPAPGLVLVLHVLPCCPPVCCHAAVRSVRAAVAFTVHVLL